MTYVADEYQVTPRDDGSIIVRIARIYGSDITIKYDPKEKEMPWTVSRSSVFGSFDSQDINGLELTKYELKILHDALVKVGKQDLMDNEIVFVEEK